MGSCLVSVIIEILIVDIKKKKAIVMGATLGTGLMVARLLLQKGWQIGAAGFIA